MSNKIFDAILQERIDWFKTVFSKTAKAVFLDNNGKLIHPGEFGFYRENACSDLLKLLTPQYLSIGTGFAINSVDEFSTQLDLVLYSNQYTPLIDDDKNQRFFPIETIAGVGEVKSKLNKQELIDALQKLSFVKKLREETTATIVKADQSHTGTPDLDNNPYDQIVTFLICDEFSFDPKDFLNDFGTIVSGILPKHRHNLVLSLKDGLFAYRDLNDKFYYYPIFRNPASSMVGPIKPSWLTRDGNKTLPEKVFSSYLFAALCSATIFFPDMVNYQVFPKNLNLIDGKL